MLGSSLSSLLIFDNFFYIFLFKKLQFMSDEIVIKMSLIYLLRRHIKGTINNPNLFPTVDIRYLHPQRDTRDLT